MQRVEATFALPRTQPEKPTLGDSECDAPDVPRLGKSPYMSGYE